MTNEILVHNCETGEVKEIPMTAEQIAERAAADEELNNKLAAKELTAASRIALLERLGITEDEAKLLLG